MRKLKYIAQGLLCLSAIFAASAASAALSKVIAVPWQGDVNKFHTTTATVPETLKGVIKTTTTDPVWYQWIYGDGTTSAITELSGQTKYLVESTYLYSGAIGQPFTAQLVAADNNGLASPLTSRYLVIIQGDTLDSRINIGIDNGEWYLYKQGVMSDGVTGNYLTFDGQPCVYWAGNGGYSGNYFAGSSASAIQAFEINGSLETGNFDQDPYAEYVHLGLHWLLQGYYANTSFPMLQAMTIGLQHGGADNPDANGNGIGIQVKDYGYNPIYEGGMVMDAIVASGTPNASSGRDFVGNGHIASYFDVVQDMCDQYGWGESDTVNSAAKGKGAPMDLTVYGVPQTLTFEMLDTACGASGTYQFYLNGVNVGTSTPTPNCSCNPGTHTVVVSGAALTSAWNMATPPVIEASYSGGSYFSRLKAILDFGGGNVKSFAIENFDPNGPNDGNLCGGYSAAAFDDTVDLSKAQDIVFTQSIRGGWRYNWNADSDNSAAQWAAIGMIAAQGSPFNAIVPQWVKTDDDNWLNYSYSTDNGGLWGHFGYTGSAYFVQPDYHGDAETPSGLVQMDFVGDTTSDTRWVTVERWFSDNWDTGENWLANVNGQTFYPMYSFTKAMRLAHPSPVVNFASGVLGGFDWYRGSSTDAGVAKTASDPLVNSGHWTGGTYWEGTTLATAWAVIVLKPNLFSSGPIACFTAAPNPGFSDVPISFDPSCSGDSQPGKTIANLTKFDWNWGDGTPDTVTTTPMVVPHSFHCTSLPCSFSVTLTVTDDSNPALTANFVEVVNITQPPHPPVSKPGGPYIVSLCQNDSLTLDGSASFSPDQGLKQVGCTTCPIDTITAWGWALQQPYTYMDESGAVVNLASGPILTFFPTPAVYNIGLQVTDNAALAFPASGNPAVNLMGTAFATVQVFGAGPCTLTATGGCQSVTLNWNAVQGATEYDIYCSSTGPNSGFAQVGTVTGNPPLTTASVGVGLNQAKWFRVQTIGANGQVTMSPAVEATDTFDECVCIKGLIIAAKSKLVQLNWTPVQGASCYDVYRSTSPNVPLDAGHRIASCVGANGLYVDTTVVNGKTYYYVVTEVGANGGEVCRSAEVHGLPNPPHR